MMNLMTYRQEFRPFQYQTAYDYWLLQQSSHWLHSEIGVDSDVYDYRFNLTDAERSIINNILKSFTQSEVLIADYWRRVPDVFPIPEVALMCSAFSSIEGVHQIGYDYIQSALGLNDFDSFLHDKTVMERLEQMTNPPHKDMSKKEIAVSLAVFSAFSEGVLLFSAFTILMSFAQRGLMAGLGQIIEYSIRDETLHAKGGCWLFNQFMSENKDIKGIKKDIYEACNLALEIEDKFIDSVFGISSLPNCNPEDLKQFIRSRANQQLKAINMKPQFKVEKEAVKRFGWFDISSSGDQHADFFASKVTNYAKTSGWGNMFEGVTE